MSAFIESSALESVIRDDEDEALVWLRKLLPGELRALKRQVGRLGELITQVQEEGFDDDPAG